MPVLRYSEDDLRRLFARAISARWPAERLLLVTRCRTERVPRSGRAEGGGAAEGFLGATDGRLLIHERSPDLLVLRGLAWLFAFLAVLTAVAAGHLLAFLGLAAAGAALWLGGRALETVRAGDAHITFDRVLGKDPDNQRLEGVAPTGTVYRLTIPDPSDYRLVAAIVAGKGNASAA